ncbi:efflux RND transporter permease subunit [Jiella sp. MQZ9-1]|uniref:Efflux RND transporter permease subunit n=1 Tax=Jiella flava TaxID=2816857 RepID=A0A939JUI7_9HYPH|nr:efflux RND transporter permease subunit [Jiella flava]MBO0661459.1 efflux RND transporter permease subunit [Jiella flava]MCD2470102.1 efflux RND transporter permease subunit [Jiella flava]
MNWNFSAWSIRHPVPPILLFVVLIALGIYSFLALPITRFPNIDVPVIAVTVTQSGAAPSELENQVTKRVEDAIAGISGIKHITSTITDGQSVTAAEFRLEVNTDRALNDVKDAIAKIRSDLPRSVDEPIIQRIEVEDQAIVTYAASSPGMTPEQLSWFVDDTVVRALQGLKGVGRVERMGGVHREIQVRLDPDRLAALGVTAATINQQLRSTNVDLSGGRGDFGGQEQAIRTLASADTVSGLADTRIPLPGGREAKLSDLGDVVDSWEEPRSFARLDGQPVVAFSVLRSKGASDTTVADVVAKRVAELGKDHPNVTFAKIDDSVTYTYGNYESAMETLAEGAILAVIVVLLFLRDWRATLVAAITLPLAAIPTFGVMDLMGFSLNLVSLLAITLVTGILVDDAIVEIENIERHMAMGKPPYRAAMEAADEIGLAVIAITATIVAVFAPVSFMGGIAGQYFKQFGLTVAIAVFFSLLVARLITPMLAAYFFRPHAHEGPGFVQLLLRKLLWIVPLWAVGAAILYTLAALPDFAATSALSTLLPPLDFDTARHDAALLAAGLFGLAVLLAYLGRPHDEAGKVGVINRGYTAFLSGTLHVFRVPTPFWRKGPDGKRRLLRLPFGMRWVTLTIGIAVFVASIYSIRFLPTGFIPKEDASRIVVSLELPPGSTLEKTRKVTDEAVKSIRKLPEVKSVLVIGGSSPTGTLELRRAALTINLLRKDKRIRSQSQLEPIIAQKLDAIPDIRAFYVNERGERELTVGILGNDGDKVSAVAANLESEMRKDPMFQSPSAMAAFARPEIRITPRFDIAADLGVTADQISQTVRVATIGDVSANLAKFNLGARQIPIRVELEKSAREDLATIRNLKVTTASGAAVPLETVAKIGFGRGPSTINRFDRDRLVKVGTSMAPGYEIGQGSARIQELPAVKTMPAGVRLQAVGDAEVQGEVFAGFASAMMAGIMMVLVVLILLFGSFFLPITILAALPLSVAGVIGALLLTHTAVSMPVVIGILMLMGIVTKNTIMLVDFAVEREKHGMSQTEAIIDAGSKRARPIIMTTLAMAAGMMPAAMATGEGGEFRAPMAIAVIGGLLVSTVLSLVLIPSIYTLMDDLSHATGRLFRWLLDPNQPVEPGTGLVPVAGAGHGASVPAGGPQPTLGGDGRFTYGPPAIYQIGARPGGDGGDGGSDGDGQGPRRYPHAAE